MYTGQSWGKTMKSQQQGNMMSSLISTLSSYQHLDKDDVNRSLIDIDKKLSRIHAHQFYDPSMLFQQTQSKMLQTSRLSLPKTDTLTDALLRSTLGCDQKYAKSYMQIIGQTTIQSEKQKRVDAVKKKFATSNSHIDFCANSKPYLPFKRNMNERPVIDNEHQAYLKTQLIFLQKPKGGNITEKQYYDKHYDLITKKIDELGGMQDTLGQMQDTLSKNQVKSSKKRQILQQLSSSPRKNPFQNVSRYIQSPKSPKNWLQRSRTMRQTFKSKLNL